MVVCASALTVCLLVAFVGLVIVKRWEPVSGLQKLFKAKQLPCFHCKKSESQHSCSSTGGLYPALTSSPTSTTVSGSTAGTPNSSNYLVQILEQQQQTLKHIKSTHGGGAEQTLYMPQKAVPQQQSLKGSSIYQVTAPRPTMLSQLTDGHGIGFRPVSPPAMAPGNPGLAHHIYMEIDPVYAQAADVAAAAQLQMNELNYQSDIQLSDISDDDLRRFSDTSSRATHYGEERPLIRTTNNQMNNPNNNLMRQSLIQAQQARNCMTAARQPLQVSALNPNQGSYRGTLGTRLRQAPYYHHSANPSLLSGVSSTEAAPIAIALQGNDQFVSLQIDGQTQ